MKNKPACFCALAALASFAASASGATVYSNLTPTNQIGIASRAGTSGGSEIEAADDFLLGANTLIDSASFVGLVVPGLAGAPLVESVSIEIYRIFPLDSDTVRSPSAPTRTNSPSDVAFASRDSGAAELLFSTFIVAPSFTILNSVQAGGIHQVPNQTTGGNGPLTGEERQFGVNFVTPLDLPAGHYFFIPQVTLINGGQFYWLSASRPIVAPGTPFAPDLQAWVRDATLDPDWLRVGTDIVGGSPAPTFNAAFSLNGTVSGSPTPEPGSVLLGAAGLALLAPRRRHRRMTTSN